MFNHDKTKNMSSTFFLFFIYPSKANVIERKQAHNIEHVRLLQTLEQKQTIDQG